MDCFYKKGLRFSCVEGCHDCCENEPGFVFLTDDDIQRIAAGVSLSVEEAKIVYTRTLELDNGKVCNVLKEYSNNRCIFLKEKGCSIYEHRPDQCRAYPFWPRVLKSKEAWDNEAPLCKGINKGERVVPFEEIEEMKNVFKFPYD